MCQLEISASDEQRRDSGVWQHLPTEGEQREGCPSIHPYVNLPLLSAGRWALDKDTKAHDLPGSCPLLSLQAVLPPGASDIGTAHCRHCAAGCWAVSAARCAAWGWLGCTSFHFFYFFLSLQNAHLAAGLASHLSQAGMETGGLSVLRLSTSSGPLEHEGHIFGTSLCPLYLTLH